MAGISSKSPNANNSENKQRFNGYEQQTKEFIDGSGLEWYDYKHRFYDHQIGRFFVQDELAVEYVYYSPYQFAGNQVPNAIDLDGLEPAFFNVLLESGAAKVNENPNSRTAAFVGGVVGVGKSVQKTVAGIAGAILHPIETVKGVLQLNTLEGQIKAGGDLAIGVAAKINTLQKGTNFEKGAVVGEVAADVATVVLGTKGLGVGVKGSGGIANPIPGKVSRVIPNSVGELSSIGRPGAADVFVTASSDIKGLNASQIAERLTIPESSTGFKVVTFETPQGIASPVNRDLPGFLGRGRTAGGAREFVVPNQPIPQNAKISIVN